MPTSKAQTIQGMVAATHTPFHTDGALNLMMVEKQAAHLLAGGVKFAFIGGTTGESAPPSAASLRHSDSLIGFVPDPL